MTTKQEQSDDNCRPGSAELWDVVHSNIQEMMNVRAREERRKKISERVADTITAFAGSMWSVYFHGLFFGGWLLLNSIKLFGIEPWDPFPYVMLAMIASVEAIFLSTFILVSQNRMQMLADRRADLDLQVNLLAERADARRPHARGHWPAREGAAADAGA